MESRQSWKANIIILGGIVGSLLGILAAYILIKSSADQEQKPKLDTKQGMRLGLGIVSLLRSLTNISQQK